MNFYSSGEEVLRDYPGLPPSGLLSVVAGQVQAIIQGAAGANTWAWQEKLKGLMAFDNILSSSHGGWKFNDFAYGTNSILYPNVWFHMSPQAAAALTNSQLQTNAFFDVTASTTDNADMALCGPTGSTYAAANRNRILSDTIPCLTLPVGANSVSSITPPGQPNRNFDMSAVAFENGWPLGRASIPLEATKWHHSDCRQVAYTFTHKLFDQITTIGNLK